MSITPAPDVLFRKFGEEAVLLHLPTERYFSLNDSALRLWELLVGGSDRVEAASTVAQEYDAPVDVVAADLDALLEKLDALGLVTVQDA